VKSEAHELIRYIQLQSPFPEVQGFTNEVLLKKMLNVSGLEAYQIASVMIIIVFALACSNSLLVTDAVRSEDQIQSHCRNWSWLTTALQRAYGMQEGADLLEKKIKFHDPDHDEAIIRRYGNFRIINELPKEMIHQLPKHTPHNNRTIEEQMLEKVGREK